MKTLLIRAEDKNRWERRVPIVPADLSKILAGTGIKACVEKSKKRFYNAEQYQSAGAVICNGMGEGNIILGIKEIPAEKILGKKTYVFFSHTIKGQKSNMPLLQKIIDSDCTLIDYEKITDAHGCRLIFFGPYAGHAGTLDMLSLMGEHWAAKGLANFFSEVRRAYQYDCLKSALEHMARIGNKIRKEGLPAKISPFTVGILGYGSVSGGVQEIFDCLPTERIAPAEIESLVNRDLDDRHRVYLTVFKEQDMVKPVKKGKAFNLQTYYNHPERYESCFEQYLSRYTLLVNAVYWDKRYPRFVTWKGLKNLLRETSVPKLAGIADISCDTGGAIECNVRSTDSDTPAYRLDPMAGKTADGHLGEGIVLMAVDNLPCELPGDSSTFFSKQLSPFVPNLLEADYHTTLETSGLCPELKRAVIVYDGQLTETFTYLKKFIRST